MCIRDRGRVELHIGNPRYFAANGLPETVAETVAALEDEGKTSVIVAAARPFDGRGTTNQVPGSRGQVPGEERASLAPDSSAVTFLGVIALADRLRPDAPAGVRELKAAGVGRVIMLTGLDYPFGYVLVEPGFPETILTGVSTDTELMEQVAFLMLKVTGYVMAAAPFAVFGAIAYTVSLQGLGVLVDYSRLVGSFFLALFILWAVLIAAGFLVLGPRVFKLIWDVRAPGLIAFATASSEAAYPRLLEQLERHGVANRVVSFVLPLGYSFNLAGSMLY